MNDTDHPALSLEDIATLTGNIVNVSADRPTTRADLDKLTAYIEYLSRMGCDGGCGRRVAYINANGYLLCWPCADGKTPAAAELDDNAERYHHIAAAAEWLDENGNPDGEATTALIADVLAVVGENTELAHSDRVRAIAAHAAGLECVTCKPPAHAAHLLEPLDDAEPEPEPDPYPDAVAGLAEAASWAQRWAHERGRANAYAAALARVDGLHQPYTDEAGRERCRGCIAGYDPATGELTQCAWPCPTEQARRGELPS